MLKLILCEDNNQQRKQFENILMEDIECKDISIALSCSDPHEVIRFVENSDEDNYIYLLDIDLENTMDGLALGRTLRTIDPNGFIIFLTSHTELTLLTFQYKVQALDYILKADKKILIQKFDECISEVIKLKKYRDIKDTNAISLEIGNNLIFFSLDEILFFETSSKEHKIRVHTETGHSEFYGSLKEIETKVSSAYYKPHRSYLVNTKKIRSIDKDNLIIEMVNGETCYVAQRYLKGLLQKCLK
ncbi:LytR/AlgR family response regulator transcription factor [Inconstantimicrobium mannanitabidum]|uniref:DNA-binding response regulator n=1 Tax=Inconstantimicrobium mannanitabidum TaxID=1604901 RepID=A0ACB5RDC7_9CLOT|nr:LytTR family DNA-binding domain-containing protein [Clostridium sp. TW13]GKX67100.1 DNA-binding response regulator [Clostridium sp. TW13]